jgi:hypothetical protein
LKRSGTLLRQTWGENIVAQAGFGSFLVAMLPGIARIGDRRGDGSRIIVAPAIIGVVWIAIVSVIISAMSGIYRTALYRYAVDGKAPPASPTRTRHAYGRGRSGALRRQRNAGTTSAAKRSSLSTSNGARRR